MMLAVVALLVVALLASVSAFAPATGRRATSSLQMTSMGRKPLMGGNWKLNPTTVAGAVNLATEVAKLTVGVTDVDIAVFPPHPFLVPVYSKIEATNVKLGGQNCYFMSEGAYTGAVSTCMLKDIGVSYVLAGHSERRTLFQDDDGAINKKVKKILKEGLKPVLCIGETKDEYEAGLNHEVRCDASDSSPRPFLRLTLCAVVALQVCAVQLMKDLVDVTPEEMEKIVIAYEPVWCVAGLGWFCVRAP